MTEKVPNTPNGDDADAIALRNVLIEDNIGLVRMMVLRLWHIPLVRRLGGKEDVFQAGMVGLLEAAKCYEKAKGEFSTIACKLIKLAIFNQAKTAGLYRVPQKRPKNGYVSLIFVSMIRDCVDKEEGAASDTDLEAIRLSLDRLAAREREIVEKIYGLNGQRQRSIQALAGELGIKREKFRLRVHEILAKLRRNLESVV